MSNFPRKSNLFLSVLPLVAVILLSGCSDDKTNNSKETSSNKTVVTKKANIDKTIVGNNKNMTTNILGDKQNYKEMSQPIDKASWVEKGKFKKEFTKECIAREVANAGNKKADINYIEKTCNCIADYMDNKLTDQEADEYLKEGNNVRAFQIRYDAAAYECVQESQKVAEPKITRFQ